MLHDWIKIYIWELWMLHGWVKISNMVLYNHDISDLTIIVSHMNITNST